MGALFLSSTVVIPTQFRGPPNSGNGGYVCGLLAKTIAPHGGPVTVMLRAPIPLDTPLILTSEAAAARLTDGAGVLIGEAKTDDAALLPDAPTPPVRAETEAAGLRFPGLERRFHPVCFTCGDQLNEGYGLRVFTGQVEGAASGVVAGPWTAHAAFADKDGLAPDEIVWAALDCPGSVAWAVSGGGAGLLGTMTCEILRRPAVGEPTTVLAWPIEQSGRKRISGTALYAVDGTLMARSRQVWIVFS